MRIIAEIITPLIKCLCTLLHKVYATISVRKTFQRLSMKILLLEDDVILQEIIEEFLIENGYEVKIFYTKWKSCNQLIADTYCLGNQVLVLGIRG